MVRLNGGGTLADADKYKVMQITPHDADLDAQVSTRGSQADLTSVRPRPTICRRTPLPIPKSIPAWLLLSTPHQTMRIQCKKTTTSSSPGG